MARGWEILRQNFHYVGGSVFANLLEHGSIYDLSEDDASELGSEIDESELGSEIDEDDFSDESDIEPEVAVKVLGETSNAYAAGAGVVRVLGKPVSDADEGSQTKQPTYLERLQGFGSRLSEAYTKRAWERTDARLEARDAVAMEFERAAYTEVLVKARQEDGSPLGVTREEMEAMTHDQLTDLAVKYIDTTTMHKIIRKSTREEQIQELSEPVLAPLYDFLSGMSALFGQLRDEANEFLLGKTTDMTWGEWVQALPGRIAEGAKNAMKGLGAIALAAGVLLFVTAPVAVWNAASRGVHSLNRMSSSILAGFEDIPEEQWKDSFDTVTKTFEDAISESEVKFRDVLADMSNSRKKYAGNKDKMALLKELQAFEREAKKDIKFMQDQFKRYKSTFSLVSDTLDEKQREKLAEMMDLLDDTLREAKKLTAVHSITNWESFKIHGQALLDQIGQCMYAACSAVVTFFQELGPNTAWLWTQVQETAVSLWNGLKDICVSIGKSLGIGLEAHEQVDNLLGEGGKLEGAIESADVDRLTLGSDLQELINDVPEIVTYEEEQHSLADFKAALVLPEENTKAGWKGWAQGVGAAWSALASGVKEHIGSKILPVVTGVKDAARAATPSMGERAQDAFKSGVQSMRDAVSGQNEQPGADEEEKPEGSDGPSV